MKIVLNRRGVAEIMRSPEVAAELLRRAEEIASAAGPGHLVDQSLHANRSRASVRTATDEAHAAEATDRNLTKALDAGRG